MNDRYPTGLRALPAGLSLLLAAALSCMAVPASAKPQPPAKNTAKSGAKAPAKPAARPAAKPAGKAAVKTGGKSAPSPTRNAPAKAAAAGVAAGAVAAGTAAAAVGHAPKGEPGLSAAEVAALHQHAEQGEASAQYALGSLYKRGQGVAPSAETAAQWYEKDRKSTRLNSSHLVISYAVFC